MNAVREPFRMVLRFGIHINQRQAQFLCGFPHDGSHFIPDGIVFDIIDFFLGTIQHKSSRRRHKIDLGGVGQLHIRTGEVRQFRTIAFSIPVIWFAVVGTQHDDKNIRPGIMGNLIEVFLDIGIVPVLQQGTASHTVVEHLITFSQLLFQKGGISGIQIHVRNDDPRAPCDGITNAGDMGQAFPDLRNAGVEHLLNENRQFFLRRRVLPGIGCFLRLWELLRGGRFRSLGIRHLCLTGFRNCLRHLSSTSRKREHHKNCHHQSDCFFHLFLPFMSSPKLLKCKAFPDLISVKTEPVGDEHPSSFIRLSLEKNGKCFVPPPS